MQVLVLVLVLTLTAGELIGRVGQTETETERVYIRTGVVSLPGLAWLRLDWIGLDCAFCGWGRGKASRLWVSMCAFIWVCLGRGEGRFVVCVCISIVRSFVRDDAVIWNERTVRFKNRVGCVILFSWIVLVPFASRVCKGNEWGRNNFVESLLENEA